MTIPVGFAQTTHTFGGNGLAFPAAVILGWDPGAGLSASDVATAVHTAMGDEILPNLTDDVQLESTICKFGPDATGPSAEFVDTVVGGVGTAGSPSNLAWLVRKNSNLGGRQGRGRSYYPGVAEALVGSDGDLDAGAVSVFQDAVTAFYAGLTLVTIVPVILHGDALTPTPMTTAVVQARAATQRRRMRR